LTETVFAPLAGITALGFLLLAPRMTAQAPHSGRGAGLFRLGFWLACVAVLLESLVLSQTRGVWLSAAIVFPVSLAVRYWGWLRNHAFNSTSSVALLLLTLAIGGLLIQPNVSFLINRIQSEQLETAPTVVKKVIEGDKEVVMTTSIGYRVIMWRIGWQKWTERPFLGWGPGTSELLLEQAGNPLLNQHVTLQDGTELSLNLSHFHSLYIEILVRFGLLGSVLFLSLPIMLLRGVGKAYASGGVPWDFVCFLVAGWGFTAIWSFFDFQIFKFAWRNYCVIWSALTYAVYLQCLTLPNRGF
jgi:O-antigen ligase